MEGWPYATTSEGTCSGFGQTERFKDVLQGLGKVQGSGMRILNYYGKICLAEGKMPAGLVDTTLLGI